MVRAGIWDLKCFKASSSCCREIIYFLEEQVESERGGGQASMDARMGWTIGDMAVGERNEWKFWRQKGQDFPRCYHATLPRLCPPRSSVPIWRLSELTQHKWGLWQGLSSPLTPGCWGVAPWSQEASWLSVHWWGPSALPGSEGGEWSWFQDTRQWTQQRSWPAGDRPLNQLGADHLGWDLRGAHPRPWASGLGLWLVRSHHMQINLGLHNPALWEEVKPCLQIILSCFLLPASPES